MINKTNATLAATVFAATLGLLTACGDDDKDLVPKPDSRTDVKDDAGEPGADGSIAGDGGTEADAAVPEQDPVYAIATQVFGASDQTSYLRLKVGNLFEGTIPASGGIERAGRALVVSGHAAGRVYYAGDKKAEIDRYDLKNDKLEAGETVSLAGEGVTSIAEYPGQLVMVSETKALYFDSRTLKVLVWNPKDMTLVKAIDVSELMVTGFSATFSTVTATKGGKVYMPVGYRTPAAVPSKAAVVVVDTATDTATVVKDERCGYVRDAVEGDDGKWYLATEAFASSVHYLNSTAAPKPCLLRFDFASDSYDTTFQADLNALAGGKTVGSLVKLPNGKVYTRVLDESKIPTMAMPSGRAIASAIAWGWSEVTLGDSPTLTALADGHVMGGSLVPFQLGDKLVIPDFSSDLAKTTLCDISEGPTCSTKTEVAGLVFSVALIK